MSLACKPDADGPVDLCTSAVDNAKEAKRLVELGQVFGTLVISESSRRRGVVTIRLLHRGNKGVS